MSTIWLFLHKNLLSLFNIYIHSSDSSPLLEISNVVKFFIYEITSRRNVLKLLYERFNISKFYGREYISYIELLDKFSFLRNYSYFNSTIS